MIDDLLEWFADWLLVRGPELSEGEEPEDPAERRRKRRLRMFALLVIIAAIAIATWIGIARAT